MKREIRHWRAPAVVGVLLAAACAAIGAAPAAAASFPDLVIAHATVSMKCLPNGTRTAKVFAIVKNVGAGPADLSKNPWRIIVDASWWWTSWSGAEPKTVKPEAGGPLSLKPGGIYPTTLTITGIRQPPPRKDKENGEYGFKITADPRKSVTETNENNNEKLLWISVGEECD